jgi:glycosyltransferase involved in cell wall biosynthesis
LSSFYNPQVLPAVRNILAELKFCVIHAHNVHNYLSYHCLKAAHDLQIPVVLTLHDAMSFSYGKYFQFIDKTNLEQYPPVSYKPLGFWPTLKANRFRYIPFRNQIIRTYLHKYVSTMVSVSAELQKALYAHGIHCTEVLHNGIDVPAFSVDSEKIKAFRNTYDLNNKKAALFAGRLSYLKGGEQVLKAMTLVCKALHDAVLLVAGKQDGYGEQMKHLAKDAGIENKVIFSGWLSREDLMVAYQCSDVVVSPSIYLDNFPTVNMEAMAMKKPVIASCFGGSKELVFDGVTGYIVNPLNIEMFAERIIELLCDKEKANLMGEAGYQRVADKCSIQQQGQKMLALLKTAKARKQ